MSKVASALLFSPLTLGARPGLLLRARTWVPAMVTWRGDPCGEVTDSHLLWYERIAEGKPAVLVVEATGISDVPSGPLLRIHDDQFIPGLSRLVEVVRKASGGETRLFLQLIHFLRVRRRPTSQKYFAEFLQPTAAHAQALQLSFDTPAKVIREAFASLPPEGWQHVLSPREWQDLAYGARERVTDMHLPHVRDLPHSLPPAFAAAAARAEAAGFDGVELHFAHAYTLASLLSPLNTRQDGYGGNLEQRLRLPLDVFRAVRNNTSPAFIVGCRYLAEECVAGGHTPAEAATMGVAFASAGFDFLSLSRGGKFEDARQPPVGKAAYPYTGHSGAECIPPERLRKQAQGDPRGRNVLATAQVRRAIRDAGFATPVVLAGGIHTSAHAEAALQAGHADVIATARQTLADPLWLIKLQAGEEHTIRQCTRSNYCEGLDQMHKQVTCKLWDRLPHAPDEPTSPTAEDGRRLLPPRAW